MKLKGTPTFDRTFNNNHPIQLYRGGTRSGKSYAMMQRTIIWLMTGHINGTVVRTGTFDITRSTLPALKATVEKDFIAYLFELNVYQFVEHIKTTHEFKYKGREVVFYSLDDPHKLRGRSRDFFWVNECTDTAFDAFIQGNVRTRITTYLDYNPSGEPWVKTEIEDKLLKTNPEEVFLDVSTFKDNPFLPDRLIKQINQLKDIDHDLWLIYTTGQWVQLKGLIYPNVQVIDEIPLVGTTWLGLDFGFNDPSVLIKAVVDGENLYIDCLVHGSYILLDDMANQIKATTKQGDKIFCDYAEPRTIEELKRRGINAVKTKPKDVLRSIMWIKQHKMWITSRSVETLKEWKMFKWDTDPQDRLIDKPINYAKHSSDALSYAIGQAMRTQTALL